MIFKSAKSTRSGAAAVETALVVPILVFITLGSVDISQYINLSQLVTNSSREGARIACKNTTESRAEIEEAVTAFLENAFPNLPEGQLNQAVTISVRDAYGQEITDASASDDEQTSLGDIASGEQLIVEVSFDFGAVRWLSGPDYWNGNTSSCVTATRRE